MEEHLFDRDTAVRRTGELEFEAEIEGERWWVARGPNGGFVAAILLRAMSEALGERMRPPRSLTVHYPGAPQVGKLAIAVAVERVGRTAAFVSARATQDGAPVALALAAFSGPFPRDEDFQTARMPDVPAPEEVEPLSLRGAPPFTRNFEYRFVLGGPPFRGGEEAATGGWLRIREPRALDAPLAAAYADAWPPAIFWRLRGFAVVPTMDLTVHFREELPPAGVGDDFVFARFDSKRARDGMWEENGELWSRDGRLIVQSRQLAAYIPMAPPAGAT